MASIWLTGVARNCLAFARENKHCCNARKTCSYCGRETDEGNRICAQCGGEDFASLSAEASDSLISDQPLEPKYRIPELPPNAASQDWVTLVKCGHMVEADGLCAHLNGAGIETFMPDENLMLTVSWGLNVYGYVRVQVKPAQYDRARELLHEMGEAALV